MRRFTAYRREIEPGTERFPSHAYNDPDAAQYEGVEFHDGWVALRWMTDHKSVSVWASLHDAMMIHGHPEYGTEIVWHDDPPVGWNPETLRVDC